jgi:hypothetical protein
MFHTECILSIWITLGESHAQMIRSILEPFVAICSDFRGRGPEHVKAAQGLFSTRAELIKSSAA